MTTYSGYTFYHINSSTGLLSLQDSATVTIVPNSADASSGTQTTIGSAPGPVTPLDTSTGYKGDSGATDTLTLDWSNGSVWTDAGYQGTGTAPDGSTGLLISYWGQYFISSNPHLNGQTVTLALGAEDVICFYPGTTIATPSGPRAVETLAMGDEVLTHDGHVELVRWMGRQTVSTLFSDPQRVLPIRIRAGALGTGLPLRDLLVSPAHALLVDGILVQAAALLNGVSIMRETAVPEVFTYHHVELARHSLILAEGMPAETFVDNIERMAFDNWAEHETLYGALPPIAEMTLPRAKSARQLPAAIRARLAAALAA